MLADSEAWRKGQALPALSRVKGVMVEQTFANYIEAWQRKPPAVRNIFLSDKPFSLSRRSKQIPNQIQEFKNSVSLQILVN